MSRYWTNKNVSLLGGASLIGTHLAKRLMKLGVASLRMVDNLSAGKRKNIKSLIDEGMDFYELDLRNYGSAVPSVVGADVVFHLASQHGGRGYVSGHATNLWNNLELDTTIFRACADANVEKVVFSSSACAYPVSLQTDVNFKLNLRENMVEYDYIVPPDGPYGMEKLIGEHMLDAYIKDEKFRGVSTRSFTVYGPLMGETHAIGAFIAKTMIKQDPFEVWGTERGIIRNWTYVEDNVSGALLAAEKLERGAINIGVEDRLYPEDALEIIWEYVGWRPNEIKYMGNKPTGPVNRVADATRLKELGWKPEYSFKQGLQKTVDWYYATHDELVVREDFERKLTEV